MALPPEVRKTVRSLDKKIKELEETKRRLIETFGGIAVALPAPRAVTDLRINHIEIDTRGRVRAIENGQRFEEFLRANGPASTAEIVAATNIPRGSISWLMRRSEGRIRRREDGKIELAS
jgi:hypothetical protein